MIPSRVTGGPNGERVTAFLGRLSQLTPEQWAALEDSVPPLRRAPIMRLRNAAAFMRAVMHAPREGRAPGDVDAVFGAIEAAIASGSMPDEGRDLAVHASIAVLLQDVLPDAEMDAWYGPFEEVIPRASL